MLNKINRASRLKDLDTDLTTLSRINWLIITVSKP
jgi:hypothetical protein